LTSQRRENRRAERAGMGNPALPRNLSALGAGKYDVRKHQSHTNLHYAINHGAFTLDA